MLLYEFLYIQLHEPTNLTQRAAVFRNSAAGQVTKVHTQLQVFPDIQPLRGSVTDHLPCHFPILTVDTLCCKPGCAFQARA